jgi:hypothetical protein
MRRIETDDGYVPMTENQLKKYVLTEAYKQGWLVYHVVQDSHSHKGGGSGYPDLTLARDGSVMFMELKQEKASPTAEQWAWYEALGRHAWHLIRPSDWYSGRVAELLA